MSIDMKKLLFLVICLLLPACAAAGTGAAPAVAPADEYHVWVTSESADQIAQIRFGPRGAEVVRTRAVGMMPVEIDGPHGVAIAPDGRYVYVSIGHGVPYGWLWKIDAESLEVVGRTMLGQFPATVAVTPDGEFGFISNFNLHGDHVPSSISKVHLPTMAEVARIETCVMPHGSRVDPQGVRHFSVCMMDELLVEIDVGTGAVSRTFSVARGYEGPAARQPHGHAGGAHAGPASGAAAGQEVCSPTWAEPSADGRRVFVTCNRAREVLEIDVERWELVRRFATGDSPYNIGVTPDGRHLLVTLRNRTDPALEVFELGTGRRVGRVETSTTLPHGIAVSGDSRYAFVSVEGVGAEPGRVDVIDLRAFRRVASVGVGQQATGIAVVGGS
jgi:DNA-binding beta-propeller fold protein YncE